MGIIFGYFSFMSGLVSSQKKLCCDSGGRKKKLAQWRVDSRSRRVPIVTESGNNESDRRADRRADIQMKKKNQTAELKLRSQCRPENEILELIHDESS